MTAGNGAKNGGEGMISELSGGPCWHGDSRSCMCEEGYSLGAAKDAALETARTLKPKTVQDLLDMLRQNDYEDDDLNRRAVLYLLDEGRLVIDREQRVIRERRRRPPFQARAGESGGGGG